MTGRKIFSTYEPGHLKIKYHATVADEIECAHKCYGCMVPCSCMCFGPLSKALRESTYIQVLENRIEFNYPDSVISCSFPDLWRINCHVIDQIDVIYFDRAVIQNAVVAECCSPCCTHNRCCPTCCGMFGEAVVIYENVPGAGVCCNGACAYCCVCCHVFNTSVSVRGSVPRHCCGAHHVLLPCIRDAKALANAINEARNTRLNAQSIKVECEMTR
jgi:hypothetical protein